MKGRQSSVLSRPAVLTPKSRIKTIDDTCYGGKRALCHVLSRLYAAKKSRSLSINQSAQENTYSSCNTKHSGDWKQQQFFATGPVSSSQKCISSVHHSNILFFKQHGLDDPRNTNSWRMKTHNFFFSVSKYISPSKSYYREVIFLGALSCAVHLQWSYLLF